MFAKISGGAIARFSRFWLRPWMRPSHLRPVAYAENFNGGSSIQRIHPPQVYKNYICGAVKQGCALASTLFNMFFSELLRFAFPEDSSILLHLSSSGNRSNFLQVSSVPSPRGVFCGLKNKASSPSKKNYKTAEVGGFFINPYSVP